MKRVTMVIENPKGIEFEMQFLNEQLMFFIQNLRTDLTKALEKRRELIESMPCQDYTIIL